MITKYHCNNTDYNSFSEIRHLFPNVSFPETITPEVLAPLGITIIEEQEPTHIPTPEEIISGYVEQVQDYLDTTARQRNYDGILSLCTYATSTNPAFSREGQAGVEWRDAVWDKCYSIMADVKAGKRPLPTDIISELPAFTWGD